MFHKCAVPMLLAAACLVEPPLAVAQASTPPATAAQPASSPKPVRKPVQNLGEEARRPRADEVVPVPGSAAPVPAPAPKPDAAPAVPPPAPATDKTSAPPRADAGEDSMPSPAPPPSSVPATPRPVPGTPLRTAAPTAASTATPIAPRFAPAVASSRELSIAGLQFVDFDAITIKVDAIEGDPSLAQYRVVPDASDTPHEWLPLAPGLELRGRLEFRTGPAVHLKLSSAPHSTCTIAPMSRIGLERRLRADGTSHPAVNIERGRVACSGSAEPWVVRTPETARTIDSASVSYDAIRRTEVAPAP